MTFKVKKKNIFRLKVKRVKIFVCQDVLTVKGKKNHQQYMRLH